MHRLKCLEIIIIYYDRGEVKALFLPKAHVLGYLVLNVFCIGFKLLIFSNRISLTAYLVKSIRNFRLKLVCLCGVPCTILRDQRPVDILLIAEAVLLTCDVLAGCEVCIRACDHLVICVSAAHVLIYNYKY